MPTERSHLHDLLRRHGLRAAKGLGQHFLAQEDVLRSIAMATTAGPDSDVVEIGAGIANLSTLLALTGARVTSLEIDRKFESLHREIVVGSPDLQERLQFLYSDALTYDYAGAARTAHEAGRRFVIAGNIPYQITSPLIMGILDSGIHFDAMTFLMQREVAERLAAAPGGRDNGAITIKVQYDCRVELLDHVPPEAFVPPPEVDSQVVRFTLKSGAEKRPESEAKTPATDHRRSRLFRLIEAAFSQRRKMMSNSIGAASIGYSKTDVDAALVRIGKTPTARAEQLGVEDYLALLDTLSS